MNFNYNKHHLIAFGWVAVIAHPIYWIWWTYIEPHLYESISLRTIGVVSCLLLLFMVRKECYFKKILPFYWSYIVIYNLPFFFTVNLIKNHFIDSWLMCEIIMIFVTILFMPTIIMALTAIFLGALGAVLFSKVTNSTDVYPLDLLFCHFMMYLLAVISAFIFNHSNIKGIQAQARQRSLKSLAGCIAHEMRNPLAGAKECSFLIKNILNESKKEIKNNKVSIDSDSFKESICCLDLINKTSARALGLISLILENLNEKEINKSKFENIEISEILDIMMTEYAFQKKEKELINIDLEEDFTFRGDKNLAVFTLFNLLKNALYYQVPINIWLEEKQDYNLLHFRDSGDGIPNDKLPTIFESFMTSGKKEGTGLGLPFCKRTMKGFDGDIDCNSKEGEFTEFILYFPVLKRV